MKSRLGVRGWFGLVLMGGVVLTGCTDGNGTEGAVGIPPVLVGPENVAIATDTVLMEGPSISGSLGVEYFFTDRFSAQVAHGIFWASSDPPTGDSVTSFATEDFGISSVGFHYYFGGSQ